MSTSLGIVKFITVQLSRTCLPTAKKKGAPGTKTQTPRADEGEDKVAKLYTYGIIPLK